MYNDIGGGESVLYRIWQKVAGFHMLKQALVCKISIILLATPSGWAAGLDGGGSASIANPSANQAAPPVAPGGAQGQAGPQGNSALVDPKIRKILPWAERGNPKKYYQDCGQGCLYGKANDTIAMQIAYVHEKLKLLRSSEFSEPEKLDALGKFCVEGEAADPCIDRYEKVQVIYLLKARTAQMTNAENKESLKSPDEKKAVVMAKPQESGYAQVPMVPLSKDLPDQFEGIDLSDNQTTNAWLQDIYRSDSDFWINEQHDLQAAKGQGGVAPGSGKVYSEKEIRANYLDPKTGYKKLQKDFKDFADTRMSTGKFAKRTETLKDLKSGKRSLNRTAYDRARGLIVETVHREIKNQGMKVGALPKLDGKKAEKGAQDKSGSRGAEGLAKAAVPYGVTTTVPPSNTTAGIVTPQAGPSPAVGMTDRDRELELLGQSDSTRMDEIVSPDGTEKSISVTYPSDDLLRMIDDVRF